MKTDRPDEPDEPSDRQNRGSAEDPAVAAGPLRAETRSHSEYYVDLRLAVSAEKSAATEESSVAEQASAEKWHEKLTESRGIWDEYQRRWPSRERHSHVAGERDSSGMGRFLDSNNSARLEAECDRIAGLERDKISPVLRSVEALDPNRKLVGFEHRLKDRERIAEKVSDRVKVLMQSPEEAVSHLSDVIRYTFQYSENRYTSGVWADIGRLKERGFVLHKIRNSWDGDQYKGVNSQWADPDTGQRFELQFHTRTSFEAKQLTHRAYERLRSGQADRFEELVLEAFQEKVTSDIPVPPGARDIPCYPESGAGGR